MRKVLLIILIAVFVIMVLVGIKGVMEYTIKDKTIIKIEDIKSKVVSYRCSILGSTTIITIEDGTTIAYPSTSYNGSYVGCDEEYIKEAIKTERVLTFEKTTYQTGNTKYILVDEEF